MQAFQSEGSTVNLTAGVATGNVALTAAPNGGEVRICNLGTVPAFINFGTSSAVTAALATSIPIPAGAVEIFTLPATVTYLAAITASGTTALYATTGKGM